MKSLSALILLSLLATALCNPCTRAALACKFEFFGLSGKIPTIRLKSPPDTPLTPRIVSKKRSEVLGVLNMNNMAPEFIMGSKSAPNISTFGKPRLVPTQFKPYYIPKYGASGIGFQNFNGNGKTVAAGRCVRVFFTDYQQMDRASQPNMVNFNSVGKKEMRCVVFMTKP